MKKYTFEDLCNYVGYCVILDAILLIVGWAMVRLTCKAYGIKEDPTPSNPPSLDENFKEV